MKAILEQQLTRKYPKIFKQIGDPMDQTCMCWGFECGDGWYWLIDQLCAIIQSHVAGKEEGAKIRNSSRLQGNTIGPIEEEDWQVEATQVKEKFGGLRFYVNSADDTVYGMIALAEHMSYSICEECGSTRAHPNQEGWISTLCPECRRKREKGRK